LIKCEEKKIADFSCKEIFVSREKKMTRGKKHTPTI
jgi:hypothetical protein